jgi:uncharacterized membrane protein YeaQ/YmgE (transglycosylase-associated protein family)
LLGFRSIAIPELLCPRPTTSSRRDHQGAVDIAEVFKAYSYSGIAIKSQQHETAKEEIMSFIAWIVGGLIAGWLTGKIMKGEGYGFFVDILLGIAGGFLGGWIAGHIGLDPHGGFIYSTLVAIAGAIILVVILRLFKRA